MVSDVDDRMTLRNTVARNLTHLMKQSRRERKRGEESKRGERGRREEM